LKKKRSTGKRCLEEEEKDPFEYKNSRNTVDSQTGNSSKADNEMNSSFITFGRMSETREEVGDIDRIEKEQG